MAQLAIPHIVKTKGMMVFPLLWLFIGGGSIVWSLGKIIEILQNGSVAHSLIIIKCN